MGTKENRTMPDRNSAYTAVWAAVRSGKIKRGKCRVCGATKTQAHHVGRYVSTKNIVWLCDKHHRSAHVRRRASMKKARIEILKTNYEKQLVYLIAAKPDEFDADNQWFDSEDIELMAHRFLIRFTMGEAHIYEEHETKLQGVFIAQSYLAPVDFTVIDDKGNERIVRRNTWIVVLWIPNEEVLEKVKRGELRGASPRGPATFIQGELPPTHDPSRYDIPDVPAVVR